MIRLVVNADDFGFTRDVNEGIVEAHRNGILTATTLMANGAAFDQAVALARDTPSLDVGCHLVLIGGNFVSDPARKLPASVPELILSLGRIPLHRELQAQVEKIRAAGIAPSHLDTHKHTHLAPPVLKAVAQVANEFGIKWVRRPFDLPAPVTAPLVVRLVSRAVRLTGARFDRVLRRSGCRTTDYFDGFQLTGRFGASELARAIRNLPDGSTEFMCHPGYCRDELSRAPTRLKESRERELRALVSAEAREAIREASVRLVKYSEL